MKKKHHVKVETNEEECKPITRQSLDICIDDSTNKSKRRYFVTSAVAGAPVCHAFLDSIETFCKAQHAQLVVLPMRGISVRHAGYNKRIENFLATEYIFNKNLQAQDFMLNPQMINPLTGLNRFGQKEYSLLIASPKQFLRTVPVSHEAVPHLIQSTGTCCFPEYAHTRQGCLAKQDHCLGGIIVEIENEKLFHTRQVQADSAFGFYDLGLYYTQKEVIKKRASAFIMGDLHAGFEDPSAIQAWVECIQYTRPKYIIIHDAFDGHSINHHYEKDIEKQINRKEEINTLEKELDNLGKTLTFWAESFPESELVIVPSNHDDFLGRYLTEVRYASDRLNHKISLTLAKWYLEKKNPLEEYIKEYFSIRNIRWLKREKDYKLHDVHIGAHGDKGNNGNKKGSMLQAELSYGNAVIGHSHAPGILRKIWQVGTSTKLLLDYNIGSPSSWLHASCLLYKEGCRQLVISIDGRWRI